MDAPELSQAGGHRARSQMIQLAGGREVTVLPVALDVYGRTVARVMLGTTDLSERMVLDGFAVATRRWCSDYVEAEEMARDTRQGLWGRDTINGIGDPAIHRRTRAYPADATPRPERAPRPSGKGRGVLLAFPFGGRRR
jgi:endonuclease YncB( thermonuclease family)